MIQGDEGALLPNWRRAEEIQKSMEDKVNRKEKIMEAAYIVTEENVNSAPGSFRLSKVAATMMLGTSERLGRELVGQHMTYRYICSRSFKPKAAY